MHGTVEGSSRAHQVVAVDFVDFFARPGRLEYYKWRRGWRHGLRAIVMTSNGSNDVSNFFFFREGKSRSLKVLI